MTVGASIQMNGVSQTIIGVIASTSGSDVLERTLAQRLADELPLA